MQNVALVAFPGNDDDGAEYDCWSPRLSAGNGIVPYGSPLSSFLVAPLSTPSDAYLNGDGTLDAQSTLVGTVYWKEPDGKSCTASSYGLQDPGGEGTYYVEAIREAQAVLPISPPDGTVNAIVVLGDGTPNVMSDMGGHPCTDAIGAAQQAASAGTLVYSVAYGAPMQGYAASGGQDCGPQDGSLTPCTTMQQIASNPGLFYSDAHYGCQSATHPGTTDLKGIFGEIARSFGTTRVLPFDLYVPPQ
jgi:hypothetical protein